MCSVCSSLHSSSAGLHMPAYMSPVILPADTTRRSLGRYASVNNHLRGSLCTAVHPTRNTAHASPHLTRWHPVWDRWSVVHYQFHCLRWTVAAAWFYYRWFCAFAVSRLDTPTIPCMFRTFSRRVSLLLSLLLCFFDTIHLGHGRISRKKTLPRMLPIRACVAYRQINVSLSRRNRYSVLSTFLFAVDRCSLQLLFPIYKR